MYRCHDCAKLFPFDRVKRYGVCTRCSDSYKPEPPPPENVPSTTEMTIEKFRSMNAEYLNNLREEKREKRATLMQTRRSRELEVISEFTTEDWRICMKHFGYKCAYCGDKKPLSQDHFVALSKGGNYTVDNIIPACKSCNSSKHDKDFARWFPHYKHYCADREAEIFEYLALMASSK